LGRRRDVRQSCKKNVREFNNLNSRKTLLSTGHQESKHALNNQTHGDIVKVSEPAELQMSLESSASRQTLMSCVADINDSTHNNDDVAADDSAYINDDGAMKIPKHQDRMRDLELRVLMIDG
jgi:hypothetical protein